jgi:hypothetical protein
MSIEEADVVCPLSRENKLTVRYGSELSLTLPTRGK